MFEELIFRGLLQGWLVAWLNRRAPPLAARFTHARPRLSPRPTNSRGPILGGRSPSSSQPIPGREDSDSLGALKLSSRNMCIWPACSDVAFLRVRPAPQWPAPIAMFALAMASGTVYERTGSLIAAIFMHATFNGLSTIVLFVAI